jgi:hypothetical protein
MNPGRREEKPRLSKVRNRLKPPGVEAPFEWYSLEDKKAPPTSGRDGRAPIQVPFHNMVMHNEQRYSEVHSH